MRADKRDKNEHDILAFFKAAGCVWVAMKPGQGFDGLLLHRGHLHIVEVKSGKRWKLTDCEAKMQGDAMIQGVDYHVITSVEDAQRLIDSEVI
jgi:hypothetical protein